MSVWRGLLFIVRFSLSNKKAAFCLRKLLFNGAAEQSRTADLILTNGVIFGKFNEKKKQKIWRKTATQILNSIKDNKNKSFYFLLILIFPL